MKATVLSNKDPLRANRIFTDIGWLEPVTNPSKDYGTFFVPEEGEEVVVLEMQDFNFYIPKTEA